MQRKSHMLEDGREAHLPKRAPFRRRRWQIGMALFLFSNIVGASVQITTLPLPLLSTLQASGLVFNALLATLLLHEAFTLRTTIGTVLIVGGAVLISFFSALPEPSHTLDQLLDLLGMRGFISWMATTLTLVLLIIIAIFAAPRVFPHVEDSRMALIRGMAYGLISGVLSAHALLLAKSAVELLVRTVADHHNQFDRYQSWLILVAFLVMSLTQLYYLHQGLKLVTTSILYPFVFCVYNIVAIMDGLIYFRQMDRLSVLHALLIALGTAILLTGVLALSWRLSEEEEPTFIAVPSPVELRSRKRQRAMTVDLTPSTLTPSMGFSIKSPRSASSAMQFLKRSLRNKSPRAEQSGSDDEDAYVDDQSPLLGRSSPSDSPSAQTRGRTHGGSGGRGRYLEVPGQHGGQHRPVSAPAKTSGLASESVHTSHTDDELIDESQVPTGWFTNLVPRWLSRGRQVRQQHIDNPSSAVDDL